MIGNMLGGGPDISGGIAGMVEPSKLASDLISILILSSSFCSSIEITLDLVKDVSQIYLYGIAPNET